MIRVQLLTGMRPDEVCSLRPAEVDRTDDVWEYRPASHKTEHHSRKRTVYIGPEAQAVLGKYLLRDSLQYCFSPAENVDVWLARKQEGRTTSNSCGNRPGTNRKRTPKRSPGDRYTSGSYRRAIHRACDQAFPPPEELAQHAGETKKAWFARLGETGTLALMQWQSSQRWAPNQLRHTAATLIRKKFGLEAAQVILGHAVADVTQIYAERDSEKAKEVVRQIG